MRTLLCSVICLLLCSQRTLTMHTSGPAAPATNGTGAGSGTGAKAGEKENNKEAAGAGAASGTPYQDARVHCCLYLIAPTGHTLKALDLVTMKKLHDKVNLVPVIAKSDTITKQELAAFKTRVRATLPLILLPFDMLFPYNSSIASVSRKLSSRN